MIERWQIYAVPLGSLAPGRVVRVPFQTDNDAPFILRGRSIGIQESTATPNTNSQGFVGQIATRFSDASEHWNSNEVVPSFIDMPNGGAGAPGQVYPEKAYPAGSIILTDVVNTGAEDPANPVIATAYYHGVKVYPDGNYGATYPPVSQPKAYTMTLPGPGRTLTIQATDTIREYPLQVPADFDYAFRAGVLAYTSTAEREPGVFRNLTCMVKDNRMRPYMNAPCHVYHVFGIPGSQGTPTTANFCEGAFSPGLFVPELYVPANQYLFFDFFRADGALGLGATTIQIVFSGSKVVRG